MTAGFHSRRVDAALLLMALIWGSSYLTAKNLLNVMTVPTLLSLRLLVTGITLLPLWLTRRTPVTASAVRVGLILGFFTTVTFWLETYGVARTSATNAGLLISLTIVFTPVLESVVRRAWLPRSFFVAAVIAVVGVALLVSSHGFHHPTLGDALMLCAAATRACMVTSSGHLTDGQHFDTLFLTLVQCGSCAVVLTAVGGRGDLHALSLLQGGDWFALAYLGIGCSVIGLLIQMWAVRETSATRASLLLGTEPLWAVIVAAVVGHETTTWIGILGGALIIGSTYVAQGIEIRHRLTPTLAEHVV